MDNINNKLNMRHFYLIFFIIPIFCIGQESNVRAFEMQLSSDSVYNKLLDFAYKEEMFISNIDKNSNFVLLSVLLDDNKKSLLSTSTGKRLSYSFIIRRKTESSSVIYLQIKVEESIYKDYVNYYIDKGVTNEASYYNSIFQKFDKFIANR